MLENILLIVSIVFGSIVLLSVIGILFSDNSYEESFKIFMIAIIIALGSFVWWSTISENRTAHNNMIACDNVGGKYIVTGTETTYIMSGKVMVPMKVDVYGCVKQ